MESAKFHMLSIIDKSSVASFAQAENIHILNYDASEAWATRAEGTGAWLRLDFVRTYTLVRCLLAQRYTVHFKEVELLFDDGQTIDVSMHSMYKIPM